MERARASGWTLILAEHIAKGYRCDFLVCQVQAEVRSAKSGIKGRFRNREEVEEHITH